jgi:hypothetical protein
MGPEGARGPDGHRGEPSVARGPDGAQLDISPELVGEIVKAFMMPRWRQYLTR